MQLVKLDPRGRCAVRALCLLAGRGGNGETSFDELASCAEGGGALLADVLGALARAEIVESVNGAPRAWRLRVAAADLCLADVLDALEGEELDFECPLGHRPGRAGGDCHVCWAMAEAELRATEALGRCTLADLARDEGVRRMWGARRPGNPGGAAPITHLRRR